MKPKKNIISSTALTYLHCKCKALNARNSVPWPDKCFRHPLVSPLTNSKLRHCTLVIYLTAGRLWHWGCCDGVARCRQMSSRPRFVALQPRKHCTVHTDTHPLTGQHAVESVQYEVQADPDQLRHRVQSRQFTSTYSARRRRRRPSIGIPIQTRPELPGSVPLVWVYFRTWSRMLLRPPVGDTAADWHTGGRTAHSDRRNQ